MKAEQLTATLAGLVAADPTVPPHWTVGEIVVLGAIDRGDTPVDDAVATLIRTHWRLERAATLPRRLSFQFQSIDREQARTLLETALSVDGVYKERRLAPETVSLITEHLLGLPDAEYLTSSSSLLNRHMSVDTERAVVVATSAVVAMVWTADDD